MENDYFIKIFITLDTFKKITSYPARCQICHTCTTAKEYTRNLFCSVLNLLNKLNIFVKIRVPLLTTIFYMCDHSGGCSIICKQLLPTFKVSTVTAAGM